MSRKTKLYQNLIAVAGFCLMFSLNPLQAQSPEVLVDIALQNNAGLKAEQKKNEIAESRIAEKGTLNDPTINFGFFISPIETRTGPQQARISVRQMFPWFGTLKTENEKFSKLAEAQILHYRSKEIFLAASVKRAYFSLYKNRKMVGYLKADLDILKNYKALSTNTFSSGEGSLADILRVDMDRENAETRLKVLEIEYPALLAELNSLLNRPDTTGVDIPEELPIGREASPDYFTGITEGHPEVLFFQMMAEIAQKEVELAEKKSYPDIGLGLDYLFIGQRDDTSLPDNGKNALAPALSLSLPIFRGKYQAAKKSAQLKTEQYDFAREEKLNQMQAALIKVKSEMAKHLQLYRLYEKQISQMNEVLNLQYTAYSNAGKDLEDVLKARRQLIEYRVSMLSAQVQYEKAKADLETLIINNFTNE